MQLQLGLWIFFFSLNGKLRNIGLFILSWWNRKSYLTKFQVIDGAYDGTKVSCTEQAILTDRGLDKNSGYSVPLEIKPSGQFEPLYKTTLSVQVNLYISSISGICLPSFQMKYSQSLIFGWKDGELPVLPLSVYGAVAMAHREVSDEYSAPYQFFFYLYDKRNVSDCNLLVQTNIKNQFC